MFMPYMVPNPDSEAGGLVKHPMYDGPGGKDLEASHVFASERNKAKHVSKVNKVAKPQATEVEPPLEGPPAPDTSGGAKYVSKVNRIQQGIQDRSGEPESAGRPTFYTPNNLMHDRGLQQRQSQSPQRFVEEGTHGMWLGNLPDALSTVDWGSLGMWAGGFAGGVGVTKMRQDIKERRAAKRQEETTISGYPRSTPE